MKPLSLILTICLLAFGLDGFAQTKYESENAVLNTTPLGVTKGYYSIGKNAGKLNTTNIKVNAGAAFPVVQKGYYSIGANNRKLGKQLVIEASAAPQKIRAPKGYYSIDRNSEKQK